MADVDPDDANVMTPLAQLLQARMDEKGWKLQDVVPPKRPNGPPRATMSHYLQPGKWLQTMPRPKAIKELAAAVQISEEAISDAAYRSLASNRGKALPPAEPVFARDDWRFQRPEGISDEQWETLQAEFEGIADVLAKRYRGDQA